MVLRTSTARCAPHFRTNRDAVQAEEDCEQENKRRGRRAEGWRLIPRFTGFAAATVDDWRPLGRGAVEQMCGVGGNESQVCPVILLIRQGRFPPEERDASKQVTDQA